MAGPPVMPLLSVKHAVPPSRPGAVVRARLAERLRAAGAARLCVVVAPAGWGKTTLLSQWANDAAEPRRVAWVSLDESDDEPSRFWTYVLRALRDTTGVGDSALTAIGVNGTDPVGVALPLLLNELAGLEEQRLLVLDDYHVINDGRVHESVEFLLSYLPESLRLVVAGRTDPPLPLARLRARGDLVEIRADDLRFTADESAAMITTVTGADLGAAALGELWQRTEGWAAGLQLAALALRGSRRPSADVADIRGDDRHILDYLSAEVLDRLEPHHREFLVQTSVLERLSAPLCDAVLGRTGSADILQELDARNLFVAALDRRRQWYRCHGLFRDVLQRELRAHGDGALTGPQLLGRAADWYASQGAMDDAVRLLIAAGDTAGATALLRESEQWFFEHGYAATYLDLGEQLARADAAPDAEVCLMLVYAAVLSGRFDRVIPWCDATDPLITDDTTPIAGWRNARASLLTMRASYGHSEDDDPAAALGQARQAVALETDPSYPGFVVARIALGSAYLRAEQPADAVEVLADAWARRSRALLPTPVILQAAGLFGLVLLQAGDAEEARRICREVAIQAGDVESAWGDAAAAAVTWLRLVEGRLLYQAGDVVAAREVLARAAELAEAWGRPADLVRALTSLAEAELGTGDGRAGRESLTRARDIVDHEPIRRQVTRELEAVETRLGRGAARAARRTGRLHEGLTDRELSILRLLPGQASQREIADALFLSVNTVKGYTKSLYRKLGASGRADAVAQGRALGLI